MSVKIKVPFVDLGLQFKKYQDQIVQSFIQISENGAYVGGKIVEEFEESFAKYSDAKYGIAVANGTDALVLCLKAYNIGPGDEVITAPNSFIASAGAIEQVGARPVFCDVAEDYNIDPNLIENCITDNTKAIIPVHLTGLPARMDEINSIAKNYNLKVFEDSAQAVGATYKGTKVGALGDAGCFSLHPLKNLHVHGDGGMITTNNPELASTLKKIRNHGLINRNECAVWAQNSRLDAIQAAIGSIKLKDMDEITNRFIQISEMYFEGLSDDYKVPQKIDGCQGVYHNFVIQVENRDKLQSFLLEKGIETKIHYPIPIHMQPAAKKLGYKKNDFPVTVEQSEKILSLPIYPEINDEQVQYVIDQLVEFKRQ